MKTTITIDSKLWVALESEALRRNQSVPSMLVSFAYAEMRRRGHRIDPPTKEYKKVAVAHPIDSRHRERPS